MSPAATLGLHVLSIECAFQNDPTNIVSLPFSFEAKSCQEYLQLPDISALTYEPLALGIEANPYILPSFFSNDVRAGIETANSICGDL